MRDPIVQTPCTFNHGIQQRAVHPTIAPAGEQQAHVRRQLPGPPDLSQRQRDAELVLLQLMRPGTSSATSPGAMFHSGRAPGRALRAWAGGTDRGR